MAFENVTINLDDYIRFIIKKWKIALALILGCAVVFAGATKIFGNEITVPHSEEYLYYEKSLKWHEEYLEESTLMSANPTSIYVETILLKNISDADLLKNYVTSVDIWEDHETERVKKYYPELVGWETNDLTGTVEVTMRHATEEECQTAVSYLIEKIEAFDRNVEVIEGASKVVVDEKLQEEQLRWFDRIEYTNSLLLDAEAGYTIRINMLAAAITGGIVGSVATVLVTLILFLIKRNKID